MTGIRAWAAVLLVACAVPGCAPRPPAVPGPRPGDDELFRAVRAREERISTLRASFRMTSERDGRRRSVDGVLAVKKPDRVRLRAFLPFGLTVLDFTSFGERQRIFLPLADEARLSEWSPFSRDDLAVLFLRGDSVYRACSTSAYAGEALATCGAHQIRIDRSRGVIRDEWHYAGEALRMAVHYAGYRPVGGIPLPHSIAIEYPSERVKVAIEVRSYELNPPLADDLFVPPGGW